MYSLPPDSENF